MRYREVRPKEPLGRFVECFWTLESDSQERAIHPERILPDGCVEIILNLSSPFQEYRTGGEVRVQPKHFLVGQMTEPMLILPTGTVQSIGIRFHPAGTFPFFRFPMSEATNKVVELAALSADFAHELVNATEYGQSIADKIFALERILIGRVLEAKHDSWLMGLAWDIMNSRGTVSIDSLAGSVGVSSRQLERRFLHEIGLSPKLFCRILRFQQIFRAFEQNNGRWAAIAAECGYYDQAHLIRDFQQFANETPSVLLAEMGGLTEALTRKCRQ